MDVTGLQEFVALEGIAENKSIEAIRIAGAVAL
jgi:hypothetical protein